MRHRSAWTRDGRPDPEGWAARAGLLGPPDPAQCLLPFCTLWTENARNRYCKSHATRWRQLGRPDSADYLTHCLQRGKARIDFRGLAPQLALELQYAVQCRHDQATIITEAPVVIWAIRVVTDAGVTSLLDRTAQQWRELAGSETRPLPTVSGSSPTTSSKPCTKAPGGRWSIPATSGACIACPV